MSIAFDEELYDEEQRDLFLDTATDTDGDLIDIVAGLDESIEDIANSIVDLDVEEASFLLDCDQDNEDFFEEACFEFTPIKKKKGRIF